jgi:4-nitrophenyl phosphatase
MQSLTESFTPAPTPASAWSTIRIGEEIHWECHGADPVNIRIPTRTLGERWVPPLPSFRELSRNTPLKPNDVLLSGVRGVLFDLDGVVYRGEEVIPGAPEFFAYLLKSGRSVGAVTNNALKTGAEYSDKLASMGINLDSASIFTSGWAAAQYVRERSEAATVFLVGGDALRTELETVGAAESEQPDFVVAGIDLTLPLQRLSDAVVHVRNGAQLIVTNPDLTVPIEGGLRAGAGAVQAFIEAAGGVKATVIGKPQKAIFLQALSGLGLNANETMMVGDTVETDIRGARAAKLRSVLVESGNVNVSNITADIQVKDISDLHEMFATFDRQKGDLA